MESALFLGKECLSSVPVVRRYHLTSRTVPGEFSASTDIKKTQKGIWGRAVSFFYLLDLLVNLFYSILSVGYCEVDRLLRALSNVW